MGIPTAILAEHPAGLIRIRSSPEVDQASWWRYQRPLDLSKLPEGLGR
jgi:hypothetical protein